MKIVWDHKVNIDVSVFTKIQDFHLFRNVRDMAAQLRPVTKALDNCQSDKCGIANACHEWINLFSDPVLQPHTKLVEKHFKQGVLHNHLVAYQYMLHPTYRGAPFPSTCWWKVLKSYGLPSDFVALLVKLLSCPASYSSQSS